MIDATPTDDNMLDVLAAVIRSKVPDFKVKYKEESRWQKFLGALAFFCPDYMTSVTSTFGSTVYFPSKKFVDESRVRAFKILAHEYVHILDRRKRKVFFEVLYTLPQLLGLLSVGAIAACFLGAWWLLWLVALLAFLPLPAYGRMALEARGYAMNIAVNIWRHGSLREETREWIESMFTGWTYYKMWPFKASVREMLEGYEKSVYNIDAIHAEESILDESEAFVDVYEILTGIDLEG